MFEIVDIKHMHHVNAGVVRSPEFHAPRPNIVNIELIPQERFSAMDLSWSRGSFEASDISIDKVFDVYVTAEGLVFSSDGKLISQTITQHSQAEQEAAFQRLSTAQIREVTTSCLLMRKRGDANYGHWLVEIIPKLHFARSICHVSGVLIPRVGGRMQEVIHDSLDMAGADAVVRVEHGNEEVFFFKELIIVWGATHHGVYMSPLVVETVEQIAAPVAGSGQGKVFISRRGALRDLANADDVEKALVEAGFSIVHPGQLNFAEQIAAVRDADIVVGVMGAGMTNMIFGKRGSKVINLTPSAMPDTFFYFISVHKQQTYVELRANTVANSGSWDEKFLIDPADIVAIL